MNKSIIFLMLASCAIAQASCSKKMPELQSKTIASTGLISMPSATCDTGIAASFASFAQKSLQATFAGTGIGLSAVGVYQLFKAFQSWWKNTNPDDESNSDRARFFKAFIAFAAAAGCVGLASYNFADIWTPSISVSEVRRTFTHKAL